MTLLSSLMMFKEPHGLQKPSNVEFKECTTCIQCHNLPLACIIIRKVVEIVGTIEENDTGDGGNCLGQTLVLGFHEIWISPFNIVFKLGQKTQMILIRYERLPEFCSACGKGWSFSAGLY